jgi:hypothetical protein
MEDWSKKSDVQVFGTVGEQPGSQASYWRDIEIKRRLYVLQKAALESQALAISEQREATKAQREAIDVQREAIKEMQSQSRIMFWSVIGIFVTAGATLVSALV